jgi:hypothetical protein
VIKHLNGRFVFFHSELPVEPAQANVAAFVC